MKAPRFLMVRLSSIGDVIHTLPALMDLRAAFPDSEIDWLVEPPAAGLLRNSALLSQVIEVSTHAWRRNLTSRGTWRSVFETIRNLRQRRYDAAFDFQGLLKSAWFSRASGAAEVLGFATVDLRESSARLFYNRQAPASGRIHRIERARQLLSLTGITPSGPARYPSQLWSKREESRVESTLSSIPPDFVVVNPGAGWPTKIWPPERLGQLARLIHQTYNYALVCTWGPGEENLLASVQQHARPAPVFPLELSVTEFACMVRRARMFIGGDTGPMHIAAAYNIPVFALFGPTTVEQNGPFQTASRVVQHLLPCSQCYKRSCSHHSCMVQLQTEEVWDAFRQFERQTQASRS